MDDLFKQCVFRQDERDMVIKAVRIVQPDYQPKLNMTTSQCTSSLVQDFYTKVLQASLEGAPHRLRLENYFKYLLYQNPANIKLYHAAVVIFSYHCCVVVIHTSEI